MLTTVLAIGAAVLAAAALVLVGLLLRRLQDDLDDLREAAAPPPERREAAAEGTGAARATATALDPGRRADDLDAALADALEAARTAAGSEAALLELHSPGGAPPVVATLGLGRSEAEHLVGSLPPLTPSARSVTLTYAQPPAPDDAAEPVRAGLAVPVRAGSRRLGVLTVLARGAAPPFADEHVTALEQVAEWSGAALARALDLRTESEGASRDPATGLVAAPAFTPTLERAVAEARLRGRVLSLVLLELDVLRQLATDEARDAVMADAAGRLHEALRTGDVACRLARTTVAVLLPGADSAEARELAARFQAAVASRPVGGARTRLPAAGVATLAPADTPEALVERARQELSGGGG